ncbi:hypothetical protein MBLNU457_7806t1 [Dothideomycetes sp. NU457]
MSRIDDDEIEEFDESPRPAKKRKTTKAATKNVRPTKAKAKAVGKTVKASRTTRSGSTTSHTISPVNSDDDDDDAFETIERKPSKSRSRAVTESDQEERSAQKKTKHRIKVINDQDLLLDQFMTQAPERSPSPNGVRGPIWLKQPRQGSVFNQQPPPMTGMASAQHGPLQKPRIQNPPISAPMARAGPPQVAKPQFKRPHAIASPTRNGQASPIDVVNNTTAASARATLSVPPQTQPIDVSQELADLPSDAFSFSSPEASPKQAIYVSSQAAQPVVRRVQNVQAPQSGLKQTTLFGALATQTTDKESAKNKKYNFPKATQPEPPTHHKLDQAAMATWVYPVNLGTIREYQYSIVSAALYNNLLVALPTGLGKTFIAATVMLNWFRWTKEAQIVFLAPTKPLVAQQVDACFNIVGIPRSQTVMLTGGISPGLRAEEWLEKRVFFMTPQTMINDLKTGICDPKRIVLVVVDEAHRATGSYSYVEVIKFIRRFNSSFRVLALTATPGSKVETVQQVIDGLDISKIEIRTEQSLDIRQYVHLRQVDSYLFDYSAEQAMIMELCSKAIKPLLDVLNGLNAYWMKDPMKLTAFGLTNAQREWSKSEAGRNAPMSQKGMIHTIFQILASLAHSISMLKFHGIGPFLRGITTFRNAVDGGETRGKYASQVRKDENFNKMYNCIQGWIKNPDFIGHPKLEHLRTVVMNHLLDAGEGQDGKTSPTRIMVFAQWRDSAEDITRVLARNEPTIRPHVFVGQADAKGSEGMDQKKQLQVIQDFKDGKYNVLVATSIGEEGLDIGEVDLIVCYDASSSPIRMLQRMGRTGRKRKGNIAILLMRDKEEGDWLKAKDNYESMQAMIAKGDRFQYHEDRSPRILPRDVRPVVDKKVVEIPPENSQADLPEPKKGKRRAPKRPPKKFFMPDGVQTGFVTASRMDGDSDEEQAPRPKSKKTPTSATRKAVRPASPPPEPAPLPFLDDVLLNKIQERELERKYQYVNAKDGNAVVMAPKPDNYPESFRELGRTKYVRHGRLTTRTAAMMKRMHEMDEKGVQRFRDSLNEVDLESDQATAQLLQSPVPPSPAEDLPKPESLQAQRTAMPPPARTPLNNPAKRPATKRTAAPAAKARAKTTPKGRPNYRMAADAEEGESSSPEPTPADMRRANQGIDLGSGDTSGEEDIDGEPDSELADFVVGSDQPIEYASSSMPGTAPRQSLNHLFSSQQSRVSQRTDDDLPEVSVVVRKGPQRPRDRREESDDEEEVPVRQRKRKRVVVDDSDEE